MTRRNGIEHFISQKLEDRIAKKLGDPVVDPHGQLIPRKDGSFVDVSAVPLDELAPGETGLISSVSDREPELLRHLASQGLTPGRRLDVLAQAPFDGPVTLRLDAPKGRRSRASATNSPSLYLSSARSLVSASPAMALAVL